MLPTQQLEDDVAFVRSVRGVRPLSIRIGSGGKAHFVFRVEQEADLGDAESVCGHTVNGDLPTQLTLALTRVPPAAPQVGHRAALLRL